MAARLRPVDLVAPGFVAVDQAVGDTPGSAALVPTPHPAPYAAVVVTLRRGGAGRAAAVLAADGLRLEAWYDGATVALAVTHADGRTGWHGSRRHGRPATAPDAVAVTLTGSQVTAFSREAGAWVARARTDLRGRVDTHAEGLCGSLLSGWASAGSGQSPVVRLTAGAFGQLGLRDLRLVTGADGTPLRLEDGGPRRGGRGPLLLTASHAGPGFFPTGHTGVWALDPGTPRLTHLADLFFRRPDRPGAYGDHATHLVRDGSHWLVATSTWGDFVRAGRDSSVAVTLARSTADLLGGRHVLDTEPLTLPTTGLTSVGVWDPHLARTDDGWLVGFVTASRFFRFAPALAGGDRLDGLRLLAADTAAGHTEGTTLLRLDGGWRVLASDGPEGPRGRRRRYPVFDLDLREVGTLDAPYLTNIPWPTLLRDDDGWLMVTFDGTPAGRGVLGYGTHGDVVLLRGTSP